MRILLDECVPLQVCDALPGHDVTTAQKMGWGGKSNSDLLNSAEQAGFGVFIVADKNLRYQQNLLAGVLPFSSCGQIITLEKHFGEIRVAVEKLTAGEYSILEIL